MMTSKSRVATGIAVGLGLLYYFNPARGAERRETTRSAFNRFKDRGTDMFGVVKRNMSNISSGLRNHSAMSPRRDHATSMEG